MSAAIQLQDVSKLYRLGQVGTGTISHDLNRWWHLIRGKEDPYARVGQVNDRAQSNGSDEKAPDYVWALQNIDLEVQEGEILGIIGRNGAGKSTLLKLLSRITAPTTGEIRTRGRIASLLEVGTGFHPELTGRENIYLNGAILGMTRHEIGKSLEEIVDFSGCTKYLDTPVKRYSSGMTVRLGFAVAAHLRCETLVVDEVLAVGDAEFTRKSMNKMKEVCRKSGKSVLLVSHNMGSIRSIATRCVLLDKGEIADTGPPSQIIEQYFVQNHEQSKSRVPGVIEFEEGNGKSILNSVTIMVNNSTGLEMFMGESLAFEFSVSKALKQPINIGIGFESVVTGARVLSIGSSLEKFSIAPRPVTQKVRCDLGEVPLNQGRYSLRLTVADQQGNCLFSVDSFATLDVRLEDVFGHGSFLASHHGNFFWRSRWWGEQNEPHAPH